MPAGQPRRAVLPVVLIAQFVIPMSISGTAIALPDIAAELGSSAVPLQWVVNGFNVAFAICTLGWGVLADRIGPRATFRAGMAVTLVGSAASAAAPGLLGLDLARIVAGMGAAGVLTGATTLLSRLYDGAERARVFVAFGAVNGLGLAAGPTVAGALVALLGWRGVFAAQAGVLAVTLLCSTVIPAVSTGLGSARPALLDFSALREPRFTSMSLVPVAGAVGFVTLLSYLPTAFQAVWAMSAATAGALMLVMTVPALIAPLVVHRALAAQRSTPGTVAAFALACLILGALGMLALRPGLPVVAVILPMVLLGLGFGLPLGFVDAEALAAVAPQRAGSAAGLLNLARVGGEALFVAGYAALLSALVHLRIADPARADSVSAGGSADPGAYAGALTTVLLVVAVLDAACLIGYLLLRRRIVPQAPSDALSTELSTTRG